MSKEVDILQFAEMSIAGFLKTVLLIIWIFLCCIFMVIVKNFAFVILYILFLSALLADRVFHKEKLDITDKKRMSIIDIYWMNILRQR